MPVTTDYLYISPMRALTASDTGEGLYISQYISRREPIEFMLWSDLSDELKVRYAPHLLNCSTIPGIRGMTNIHRLYDYSFKSSYAVWDDKSGPMRTVETPDPVGLFDSKGQLQLVTAHECMLASRFCGLVYYDQFSYLEACGL